jgi:hypothetical protein
MGYKSLHLPYFDPATSSPPNLATYGTGAAAIVDADTKIHGSMQAHAFMWTPEGYPLSINIVPGINRSGDPTLNLNYP